MLEDLKYEIEEESQSKARIKVVGIGGCGSNIVAHMMGEGLPGTEFWAVNTDFQALDACPVTNKLALGSKVTNGRGAGGDPEVGKQAVLEDTERIVEILQGADVVFLAAGMGSGTGTGGAPVIASLAKNLGALTIGIVTKPFTFEGPKRLRHADKGLEELAQNVDTVISIHNDRLLQLAPEGTGFVEGFRMGHEFLRQTVNDIVEIMTTPGFVNRDFSDVRAAMAGSGYTMLGTATARGENAAAEAAREAIGSPLLESTGIYGARNVLMNIAGSSRLGLHDINAACSLIREATGCDDCQVNFGIVLNESMGDAVKVTVIATGFVKHEVRREDHSAWLSEAQPEPEAVAAAEPEPAEEPVRAGNGTPAPPVPVSEPEYYEDELDRPAIERRRSRIH